MYIKLTTFRNFIIHVIEATFHHYKIYQRNISIYKTPSYLTIIKSIPTKRTRTSITSLKPLEQTRTMEKILARPTLLRRQLSIPTNDTIANSTFRLPLQRTSDIAFPSRKPINQIAIAELDDALTIAQPRLPFTFVGGDAVEAFHACGSQRVSLGEADEDGHGLFVDEVGELDFAAAGGDFGAPVFVVWVGFYGGFCPLGYRV
jgi:hypothetical protein